LQEGFPDRPRHGALLGPVLKTGLANQRSVFGKKPVNCGKDIHTVGGRYGIPLTLSTGAAEISD
jgi:hypothetical protein